MRPLRLAPTLLLALSAGLARADGASSFASGPLAVGYVVAGLGLPLLRDGAQGKQHAYRTLDALGTTFLLTEGLKSVVRERRPDGSDRRGFPSAHASLTFAVATMQAQFHPKEAVYWYTGAALIGASRVDLDKHYVHDVLAGAALGYGVARLELSLPHGLILQPLIGERGKPGLVLSGRF